MKANAFEYVRAASLDDALAMLRERRGEAKILAGGQSLIPAMNMRLAMPSVLVDLSRLTCLRGIQFADGVLRIGAMARHVDLLKSPLIAEHAPLITRAMPHVAHPAIRNRGTFGGSLCMADPAAELPACMLALDARLNIQRTSGARTVAAKEFFQGIYTTCLAEDEVLVSVDVPGVVPGTLSFFDEASRRKGDYAMAGLAAKASLQKGRLQDSRLVFFAVSDKAVASPAAEAVLNGASIPAIDADAVCRAIATDIEPLGDLTTSGAAKLAIMQALARRALTSFATQGGSAS